MKEGNIGLFDSGIGGMTILEKLKLTLPNENYIFYADSKNNPYGNLDDETLHKITSDITEYLKNNNCKIVVIACNTATTRCINYLRNKFKDILFVGTEPAIKVACDRNYKNILVLATTATIGSDRTKYLVNSFKKDNQNIYLQACPGLANAIETNNKEKQIEIISEIAQKYKKVDAIVLGCTHYPLVSNIIKKYFDADLIDGSVGVSKQVKRLLEENNLINNSGTCQITIKNSKDSK